MVLGYFTCNAAKWTFFFSRVLCSAFDLPLLSVLVNIFCGPEFLLLRLALLLAILCRGFLFTVYRRPRAKEKTICAFFLVLAFSPSC